MVKRISFRPYFFVAFALMVMMFCWESNRIQAAVLDSSIPKDAIRIRILANSDSVQDQWIKREVQNAVVNEISVWVLDPQNMDEARAAIKANIPQIEQIVSKVLVSNGFANTYRVELGQVPFPEKQFGNKVYPAGNYEALRIVLGSGQGQNWWCVLFPPLCFVGVVKAQAAPVPTPASAPVAASNAAKSEATTAKTTGTTGGNKAVAPAGKTESTTVKKAADSTGASTAVAVDAGAAPKTEVKFFLWEVVKKVVLMVKSLFA